MVGTSQKFRPLNQAPDEERPTTGLTSFPLQPAALDGAGSAKFEPASDLQRPELMASQTSHACADGTAIGETDFGAEKP